MARPPRACWVHKPWHLYRNLPRPNFGPVKYDYEDMEATPEHFEHKLPGTPPKLWVAWLYRFPERTTGQQRTDIIRLFGEDLPKAVNRMKVFKNTPYWNDLLWKAKSFIEVRPITFPHGEPTERDVNYTTLLSTGECVVDKTLKLDEQQLTEAPEDDPRNFPRGYIPSKLLARWDAAREIQEDDVWSDPNHSRW